MSRTSTQMILMSGQFTSHGPLQISCHIVLSRVVIVRYFDHVQRSGSEVFPSIYCVGSSTRYLHYPWHKNIASGIKRRFEKQFSYIKARHFASSARCDVTLIVDDVHISETQKHSYRSFKEGIIIRANPGFEPMFIVSWHR